MKNNLKYEKSLYLKQHSENPVNWLSLRDDPFKMALDENKPVFISIGYSACHWCHVMSRKTFCNQEIADYLNTHFISVKIDREEYPDMDKKYQFYLQIIRNHGGWPLSVFTDFEGVPFYGGTYFPPEESHGLPRFIEILKTVNDFYHNDKQRLLAIKENYKKILAEYKEMSSDLPDVKKMLDSFELKISEILDFEKGGLSGNNKFPNIPTLLALLEPTVINLPEIKKFLIKTANILCTSGIYDHINGGFFRYCVDTGWNVPHFEKMLYDNALNTIFLSKMYMITENPLYLNTANHALEFLFDQFFADDGFIASMNSESKDKNGENVEGYYYLVSEDMFKGLNSKSLEILSQEIFIKDGVINLNKDISPENLKFIHDLLGRVSIKREKPSLDNKIILSWNALLATAMFEFFEASSDEFYLDAGLNLVTKIITNFTDGKSFFRIRYEDSLFEHTTLEDFAFILQALIKAYDISKSKSLFLNVKFIFESALKIFYKDGILYYDRNHEVLETFDEAVFSAFGVFFECWTYLKDYVEENDNYEKIKLLALDRFNKYPLAHPTLYRVFSKLNYT